MIRQHWLGVSCRQLVISLENFTSIRGICSDNNSFKRVNFFFSELFRIISSLNNLKMFLIRGFVDIGLSGNVCVNVADAWWGFAEDICSVIENLAPVDTIPRNLGALLQSISADSSSLWWSGKPDCQQLSHRLVSRNGASSKTNKRSLKGEEIKNRKWLKQNSMWCV